MAIRARHGPTHAHSAHGVAICRRECINVSRHVFSSDDRVAEDSQTAARKPGHERVVLEDGLYVISDKPEVKPPTRAVVRRGERANGRTEASAGEKERRHHPLRIGTSCISVSCSLKTSAHDEARGKVFGWRRSTHSSHNEARAMELSLLRGFSATSGDEVTLQGMPSGRARRYRPRHL